MMEFTIEINTLVYGGFGLGRLPDDKAVFVPFVLPGEIVRIRIREDKKRFAYADLIEVVQPSPERIPSRCSHFGFCGGCHYQHISYEKQISTKQAIFREQLQRMGGIDDPPDAKMIPCPQEWNYRNAIQFHLTDQGELAFMDASEANAFKVEECFLPMDEISKVWPLLTFEEGSAIDRIEIRQNEQDDVLLKLEGAQADIPEIEITSSISSVHINENETIVLAGDDHLMINFAGRDFRVSAGSFFQTNFAGAKSLLDCVVEMTEGLSGTLLDLYCGVGLFSVFLADRFSQIVGIEASDSACLDFAENLDQYEHISLYQGTVEKMLPSLEITPDCIVVDPPRKGLDRFALDALAEKRSPVLVYVSCNPSTFARDVKRLMQSGYRLEKSILVDMFPQTFHIESVNYLTLK